MNKPLNPTYCTFCEKKLTGKEMYEDMCDSCAKKYGWLVELDRR
ncbi:hypothetical protein J2S04_002872 [Alicyclobacillus tengchongensis]|uniref:Uncharacterized protein n=1 Tax=Alicyclobacillus tolerans TaxID=90970 RepID=A0ABT9M046_9BACL|nr:hypothetical protein [Alicyclobacillus tengchongensis]